MRHIYFGWLTLLFICLVQLPAAHASHIVGVDIRYDYLGSCVYRIYLTQYFDCAGAFMTSYLPVSTTPPPTPLALGGPGFYFTGLGACSLPSLLGIGYNLVSYAEVTPLCPSAWNQPGGLHPTACDDPLNPNPIINGIVELTRYVDYNFCNVNCSEYLLTFDDCCRNSIITSGAADDGIFFQTLMNVDSLNSSPVYTSDPVFLLCNDGLIQVPLGGTDPDGDSLVYSLEDCLEGFGVPVGYDPGYSSQVPLGSTWNVSLDSQTGLLTLTPNVPGGGAQVVGIVCVEIQEYRNGILVGKSTRDFQITILPNCNNSTPSIGPMQLLGVGNQPAADTLQTCMGSLLHFQIEATDPDLTDTLTLISDIAQILPGATVSFSGINPAIMDVSWTSDSSNINQMYEFVIDANDFICPLPGTTKRVFYIEVTDPCISALVTDIACQDSTGVIDLTVVGDSGVIYTYLWSTGDTTEDLQGLSVGSYWVDVFDGFGQLYSTDTFFVNTTDLMLIPTYTIPDCGASDGQIDVAVTGGTMPYSYSWSNGSQMSSLMNVPAGGYSVMVTDVYGCPQQAVYFLDEPDSCFVSVSGTAFHDLNGNCVQDNNELGIPYLYIELTPGGATFTDQNGNYTVALDIGSVNLEVQPVTGNNLSPLCPANGQHSLTLSSYDADTSGLDFAMAVLPVQDLRIISGMLGVANSGFPYIYGLSVHNDGNIPINATITLDLDPLMSYTNSSVPPQSYDPIAHQLTWQINLVLPGQVSLIEIYGLIDSSTSIGDSLLASATVAPIVGDNTVGNNMFVDSNIVVGAFDPNDKQVSPAGFGTEGFIQASENEMVYTVRFQNTGNFSAQFVVIRDTIDPNLDLSSYRPVLHSHTYTLDVEEDSILVFRFDNINLPDSLTDPTGSQGMVRFKLNHEGTLAVGEQIYNSAAIYFDFNAPILTNEVLNTIYSPMTLDFLSDELLCEGDSIIGLLAEEGLAPFDYTWNTGTQSTNSSQTISSTVVTTPGYYALSVTDALGISVTDSVFLDVTQFPVAQANIDIQGSQVQFTDASLHADSWFWQFGDGTTSTDVSPVHTYTGTGAYIAQLIVSNSCGMDTISISLPLINSADDFFAQSVEVLPNPFSQQTMIRFTNSSHVPLDLMLMDVRGKVVRSIHGIHSEQVVLNRKSLSQGLYLFRLSGEGISYSGKLIIEE